MERQARRWVLLALVVLVWVLNGAVGLAAEDQAQKPQFWCAAEEDIKPELMATYMQARIADAKLCAQHKFEFPFLTFVQGFRVCTYATFSAFAQIDNYMEMVQAWNEKTGGKSKQLEKQAGSCVSRVSTQICVFRPDLSHMPTESAFVPDFSQPFYQSVIVYHIKPGKYEEAEAVAKKIKELEDKRQSPMAYYMYERIFGQDSLAFIGVACAKDKAAFVELDQKMQANPDQEIEKLFTDNLHLITKIEMKEGTFVPEASYVPEGTF